jgi:hypothetical protein
MSKNLSIILACLAFMLVIAGCTQQGANGRVVFTIADKAANLGDVTSVVMTIDSVMVQSPTSGWVTVASTQKSFDLLKLNADGNQALLADANLTNGSYNQVRLQISKVVVTDAAGTHEAKLPSGDLRIVGGFDVSANSTSSANLDFILDKSLHITGNGQYILAPVVHLQTKEGANVTINNGNDVRVSGGSLRTDTEVGMDENGTVGEGRRISPDSDVSIGATGAITVGKAHEKGRAVVAIGDKAANMSPVTSINVTIGSVMAQSATQGWINLSSTPGTYDLIQLRDSGDTIVLADIQIENGTYQQIRLEVTKVVVTDSTGAHEAKLPSGELKIVGPLVVGSNSTSTVFFDFIANESLHMTGNGKYVMAPVVRVVIRENATAELKGNKEVAIRGGVVRKDDKEGMDEKGNFGAGISIHSDADVSIDEKGNVRVKTGPAGGSANFQQCISQCEPGNAGNGASCKDGCAMQEASDTMDTTLCDSLVDMSNRPSCYGTVAKGASDISVCNRLPDATDKNHCLSVFGSPGGN